MPVSVVIGAQWGDEGKGKLVDLLSKECQIVARYQGGANAGHTIIWTDEKTSVQQKFVLHLVPSGIFQEGVACVIGNGVVIDPVAVMEEIRMIRDLGYEVDGRLFISHNAHLIMPYHKALDQAKERSSGGAAIGTTGRGIGPAYVDKFARSGIRVVDLLNRDVLAQKLKNAIEEKNALLKHLYGSEGLNVNQIIEEYVAFDQLIDPFVTDTAEYLNLALKEGKNVLAEGAQGALLDVDFGTYPYVTSSHPTVGGCCTGLGIPPTAINRIIGIAKAYATRVGNGPFPTELENELGEDIRRVGHEFGATTGRPRRTGWLDLVALKYTAMINGLTVLAITKLDVLSGLETVQAAVAYGYDGKVSSRFPSELQTLARVTPVFTDYSGWKENIEHITDYNDLPEAARNYLQFVESFVGVPIRLVSTGPAREQTIIRY